MTFAGLYSVYMRLATALISGLGSFLQYQTILMRSPDLVLETALKWRWEITSLR